MLEIRDLQFLNALARHKHFAKAAQECGVSQPAFSMRIRKLEERLNTSIVRRGNRFEGLTNEGEAILRHARRILDDVKYLEQELLSARGQVAGTLALGVAQNGLAFIRQPLEPIATAHDAGVQTLFKLADAHRKGGLRHPAFLRGLGKMLMPRQRVRKVQMADFKHLGADPCTVRAIIADPAARVQWHKGALVHPNAPGLAAQLVVQDNWHHQILFVR